MFAGASSGSSSTGSSGSSGSGGSRAGPAAGGSAAPLPLVPTAGIRAALPTYVEVGTWDKTADAFDWLRFDATGHLITGWHVDPADGSTYYMNPASDGTQGKMMTGWVVIDGKEYYFNPSSDGQRGRMYKNEAASDGHFVGPDGAKIR